MAETFILDLVTPERTLFSGSVQELVAPGVLGEFGVLPGHANMLAELTAGRLVYRDESGEKLMAAAGGKIVSKGGAEGYQAIGIKPGVLSANSPGIGIAIKISDGDLRNRARPAVALEILTQLGVLTSDETQSLADLGPSFPIYNWRKILVGEAQPLFDMEI